MRILMTLAAAGLISAAFVSGQATADTKMEQCAAQWNQLKAANKTGGQSYKDFSSKCLKGQTAAPAPAAPAPKPAAAVAKPAAATATGGSGKTAQNNKMKDCAAQWNTMKAQNKTGGMTYNQWSTKCLKK